MKCVLGAATWMNPHVLVLDEPTNYLDRESLGALTAALNDFGGGVVIISHQFEFTNAICKEKWLIVDGRLTTEGESWAVPTKIVQGDLADEASSLFPPRSGGGSCSSRLCVLFSCVCVLLGNVC